MSALTERMPSTYKFSRSEREGIAWVARAGFVARGVNYLVVGILAIHLAWFHGSGHPANQQGALQAIDHQPLGKVLLVLLALGLAGYAGWRLMRAAGFVGPEGGREDSVVDHVVAGGSGFFYGALCALAVSILVGGSSGSSQGHGHAGGGILAWPAGRWLVAAGGVLMLVLALGQVWKVVTTDFLDDDKTGEMSALARAWVVGVNVVGYVARGVVFGLIGFFLVKAAVTFQPKDAVGLDGALQKVEQAPYGPALLTIVAIGLIVFALASFTDARYRRL